MKGNKGKRRPSHNRKRERRKARERKKFRLEMKKREKQRNASKPGGELSYRQKVLRAVREREEEAKSNGL